MQVDEPWETGSLGIPLSHTDCNAFMQTQDVFEVVRKILKKIELVRTGVAKYLADTIFSKYLIYGIFDGFLWMAVHYSYLIFVLFSKLAESMYLNK